MASRLYRTTRRLYIQVAHVLAQLGLSDLGSPTMAALIALYLTGLIPSLRSGKLCSTCIRRRHASHVSCRAAVTTRWAVCCA